MDLKSSLRPGRHGQRRWSDLDVFVVALELTCRDVDVNVCWIFYADDLADSFADLTGKFYGADKLWLLHSHIYVVEGILTGLVGFECGSEAVTATL